MTKARWIWATAATIAILAALGAGLWFGGGPFTREGWESAAWAAGITTTLPLIGTAITWAVNSKPSPPPPPSGSEDGSHVGNTVNEYVSDGTVIQGRDVHTENFSYGGDHIDFSGGTFHGPVTGKQGDHPRHEPGNDGQEPNQ